MNDRRDRTRPVTIINRFTLRGGENGVEEFAHEFQRYSQYLRRQPDFGSLVTLQPIHRPDVYVRFAYWRSLKGFLRIVHDEDFLSHVQNLGELVDVEADQAVSIGREVPADACAGAAGVVLTHADVRGDRGEFERRYAALTDHCRQLGGFGGHDLLRSTVQPLSYFGLSWWNNIEDCDRALRSDGYRRHAAELGRVARVSTERTRHIT